MQSLQLHRRIRRWQSFWSIPWLITIVFLQILMTIMILGLEIVSMILNMKYSFFFFGFMASFVFILTWISIVIDGTSFEIIDDSHRFFFLVSCCRRSRGCATYNLILNILSIAAASVLLFYDVLFLREPHTCLWPDSFCTNIQLNLNLFGLPVNTSENINDIKFTLIKIQIACAAVMICACLVYIGIYIYTTIRMCQRNTVADSHTIIELGRVQQPPPPFWPETARDLPPSVEF